MTPSLTTTFIEGKTVRVWLYDQTLTPLAGINTPLDTIETQLGWYTWTPGVLVPPPGAFYWIVFFEKGTGVAFASQYMYWTGEVFLDAATYSAQLAEARAQAAEHAADGALKAARLAGQLTQV